MSPYSSIYNIFYKSVVGMYHFITNIKIVHTTLFWSQQTPNQKEQKHKSNKNTRANQGISGAGFPICLSALYQIHTAFYMV